MAKIRLIKVDELDQVDFYFEGSNEVFTATEFREGTLTRKHLDSIVNEIQDYNSEIELKT